MKLVIPYIGELLGQDRRLIRLAEFLGIPCMILQLERQSGRHAGCFETVFPGEPACFVVNPQVLKDWLGGDKIPPELVASLLGRFAYLLVHSLSLDRFGSEIVTALSGGRFRCVQAIDGETLSYDVAKGSRDVCGAFSGLSFGPSNPTNDRVLARGRCDDAVREMISIGGRPFMALVKEHGCQVLFLASDDVVDVDAEADDLSLVEYFSRFVPHAMALRYVFGEQSWRPCRHHASFIIDDPLLRKNYGFLNLESLHRKTVQHKFHVVIAFIPHNFRRNSPRITQLFRENPGHLSICFHGNDHTGGEFAATEKSLLHTRLSVAEHRMNVLQETTGLPYDKVMVFPQGQFSLEAMSVLKSHNFHAAVNTVPHPAQLPLRLTIRELSEPAVLRYGDFPLFIRNSIQDTQKHDIAFKLFFGRPILIVEHHEVGRRLDALAEFAEMVNAIEPEIHWSNLGTVVSNSILKRRRQDGTYGIRAYSACTRVCNDSRSVERYGIEWSRCRERSTVEQVFRDTMPCHSFEIDDVGIRVAADVSPGRSEVFSVQYKNDDASNETLGFRWKAKAFVRRRLSEVRDNYVVKNRHLLSTVQYLRRLAFSVRN